MDARWSSGPPLCWWEKTAVACRGAVAQRLEIINQNLPEGVSAITVYDRTDLVDKAIATVRKNLIEGAIRLSPCCFCSSATCVQP